MYLLAFALGLMDFGNWKLFYTLS